MFVSHEKNVGKKIFQKPNILRRKSKVLKSDISNDSFGRRSVVDTQMDQVDISDQYLDQRANHDTSITTKTVEGTNKDGDVYTSSETDVDPNITVSSNILHITSVDKPVEQSSLNIESFINGGITEQNLPSSINEFVEKNTIEAKSKWCFDLTNYPMDVIINDCNMAQLTNVEQKSHFIVDQPSEVPIMNQQSSKQLHEVICAPSPNRTVSVELFSNRAVKFKCDEPNCKRGFWTEDRLKKHKTSHNRQSSVRPPSQVTIQCPVKKTLDDGVEEKCTRTFQLRRDLLKHLNTEHSPDDALHRCEVCGRRFFWASGLRAHAQSLCARGGLACAWPGCDRVFRLPCRLREHARSHTGDRPYVCKFPECGWAFRSASKLVRHARRHTDERRHVCGACGRAFLRREHLRDHAARHHDPHNRPTHVCTHAGCEQSFTNMSTLYMHMKKVHRKDKRESVSTTVKDQTATTVDTGDNIYLVSVMQDGEELSEAAHAARTHCTWPLSRRSQRHDPALVLDDDGRLLVSEVDNAECSTSSVYTVRSDLFLHGNVPIDDDSQNIGGVEMVEDGEVVAPLDTDLCLIDSHPTIDLMQEELMYDDAAVDESTFRVFLMNGEELT